MKNDETLFQQAFEKYQKAVEIKSDLDDAYYNWGNNLGYLARMKSDEALFQQAFEKYQEAVKIKPDKHEAYNGIGILLIITEQFDEAINYFSKAVQLASQSNLSKNDFIIYLENLYHAYFDKTSSDIQKENWGSAKEDFASSIEIQEKLTNETVQKSLLNFFNSFISPNRIDLFEQFIQILKEHKSEETLEFLNPFIIVNQYWKQNNDQEVIDRLNPEVREIVEQILENVKNRDRDTTKKPKK